MPPDPVAFEGALNGARPRLWGTVCGSHPEGAGYRQTLQVLNDSRQSTRMVCGERWRVRTWASSGRLAMKRAKAADR
jgi:hypothetical protein